MQIEANQLNNFRLSHPPNRERVTSTPAAPATPTLGNRLSTDMLTLSAPPDLRLSHQDLKRLDQGLELLTIVSEALPITTLRNLSPEIQAYRKEEDSASKLTLLKQSQNLGTAVTGGLFALLVEAQKANDHEEVTSYLQMLKKMLYLGIPFQVAEKKNCFFSFASETSETEGQALLEQYVTPAEVLQKIFESKKLFAINKEDFGEIAALNVDALLLHAAKNGHLKQIEPLLALGANINHTEKTLNPTTLAALNGHPATAQELERLGGRNDLHEKMVNLALSFQRRVNRGQRSMGSQPSA